MDQADIINASYTLAHPRPSPKYTLPYADKTKKLFRTIIQSTSLQHQLAKILHGSTIIINLTMTSQTNKTTTFD
jgi:hypothetical protein